jgi:DNA polymerase
LALQYQGRVGAFVTFAAAYGIDLEELAVLVQKAAPLDVLAASEEFLLWWRRQGNDQFGLSDAAFIACDVLTRLWREAHDAISSYWGEIENACFKAMANPGVKVPCRRCYVVRSGAWLRIVLPSGRSLCYPSPQVTDGKLTYMGVNQYSRKWCRLSTYGGKLFENMCQSVARDVLYDSMPGVEDLGYQIVLHVHDELITEAPDIDRYSAQDLAAQMAAGHEWTEGLPLAAAGFETYRYFKEQ